MNPLRMGSATDITEMGNFWKEKTHLPENTGYALFSAEYFLALALTVLVIVAAVIYFGRQNKKRQDALCRVFAWVPLGMELLKVIVLLPQGCYTPNYYPIGFCSLVIYLYPVYACTASEKVRRVARCIICMGMLPAGLAALLFPNWIGSYPFLSYFSLHSYLWHAVMLFYPMWTWQRDREKLQVQDIIYGYIAVMILVPFIFFINRRFGTNYWFLSEPTDNHPLAAVYRAVGAGAYFAVLVLLGMTIPCIFGLIQNALIPRLLSKARTSS